MDSKTLAEGISGYLPYVGDLSDVLTTLEEGLRNGMVYAGAQSKGEMKQAKVGIVTVVGQKETGVHDLFGRL